MLLLWLFQQGMVACHADFFMKYYITNKLGFSEYVLVENLGKEELKMLNNKFI